MKTHLRRALALLIVFIATPAPAEPGVALQPIQSAGYDAHGQFLVNGKPFFPILLYDAPTDEKTLEVLSDFGFNVLTCKAEESDTLASKGFYGAIHVSKKVDSLAGVLLAIGADSPAMYMKNLLKDVAESNTKIRAAAPGRPVMNAIGRWDDEPAGVIANKLLPKEKYDDLVAAIDVAAPYLYPVPYQPVSTVGEAVARARAANGGKRPVLPILQLFTWDAKERFPSPEELRCMVFLSLVEGANGIGYYSYGSVVGHPKKNIAQVEPELWGSVKELNKQVAEIGPRLAWVKKSRIVSLDKSSPAAVKIKVIHDKGGLLVVLVNTAETKQEARLSWQGNNTNNIVNLKRDGGNEYPEVKGGVATLMIEPFGVAVLRDEGPR